MKGQFACTEEQPGSDAVPIEFSISNGKLSKSVRSAAVRAPAILTAGLVDRIGAKAAEADPVKRGGNSRYA